MTALYEDYMDVFSMKKPAKSSDKTNSLNAKLVGKKADPRLKPLAIHIGLAVVLSGTSYAIVQHFIDQQTTQNINVFGQQSAALIERYLADWQTEGKILAQQPTLKSTATVKAVIGADGVIPPNVSFADQDLLNRTKNGPTGAELAIVGGKTEVTTVNATADGSYILAERSASSLIDALKHTTPLSMQLKLTQKISGGQGIEAVKINGGADAGVLQDVSLKAEGWQLQVGSAQNSAGLNPVSNIPLLAGLLALIAGLLPLLAWLTAKLNFSKPQIERALMPEVQLSTIDSVAQQLASAPAEVAAPIAKVAATSAAIAATPAATTPSADLDDFDDLMAEPAQTAAAPEAKPDLDFTFDNDVMLPDMEFSFGPKLPKHIFRAYDIRGKVSDLTPEWLQLIAKALGSELRARGQIEVVVGYDARNTSEDYARIMRTTLAECGLQVLDIGRVPTPVMHFAARQHQGNGIMITASHNPAEYNGVKWLMQRQSPLPEDIDKIYDRAANKSFIEGKGKVLQQSFTAAYLDEMLNDVILNDEVHVVIDGMSGVMGKPAQQAFEISGCDVVTRDIEPDGDYPHGNPDPCEPNRLKGLVQEIHEHAADIGFAFDGDGDRLVVVDRDGTVVTSDQLMAVFSMMILESRPGTDIVFDVKCSRMVSQTITNHGGRPIMSRSGNTFIRHAVMSKEHDVAFGGEFSGHYFFNDGRGHATDDSLYAAMRLLEWLGQRGQTLGEVLKTLPARVGTPDIYLPTDGDLPEDFFAKITEDAGQISGATLTTIDGVRLDFSDGFGIIRASNTGAFVTLRFEADNQSAVQRIHGTFFDLLAKHQMGLATKLRDWAS
jgi:phosphomannomutase/phosphoglucomutase